jgi:hypothetical protein
MPSLPLRINAPDMEDLTALVIFEGVSPDGPFRIIENVTAIGEYPDYIDSYTTDEAASLADWFTIQWIDSKGAKSDMSEPIQGGSITLISEIVSTVMLLDSTVNERIAVVVAEGVIEKYLNTDPYTITTSDLKYSKKMGLALFTLAACYLITETKPGSSSQWTAGLVSMKTSEPKAADIERLEKEARRWLGIGNSVVAQMTAFEIAGGLSEIKTADISRLLIEVE